MSDSIFKVKKLGLPTPVHVKLNVHAYVMHVMCVKTCTPCFVIAAWGLGNHAASAICMITLDKNLPSNLSKGFIEPHCECRLVRLRGVKLYNI